MTISYSRAYPRDDGGDDDDDALASSTTPTLSCAPMASSTYTR
jgi:hypothetical protein